MDKIENYADLVENEKKDRIRNNFLEKLVSVSNLQLPANQYLIWGSGPLAIRGLRDATDIDLVVNRDLWRHLIQRYTVDGPRNNRIKLGMIEIWSDLLNLTERMDEIISDAEIIEKFPLMKLQYTLEWKRFWSSAKDPHDICVIESFLQNQAFP